MSAYAHVYTYEFVCMFCVCVCVFVCACMCACVCACAYSSVHTCTLVYMWMCGCIYVCLCVLLSVCACVWYTSKRMQNKLTMAALISTTYHAPCLSLCVVHTFTLSLKARQLVKRLRRVLPNRGVLAKITARLAKSTAVRFPHKSRGKQQKYGTFLIKMRRNQF